MNNQEILDNAPDGATHFDGDYFYICNEDARKSSQIWNVLTAYGWDGTGGLTLCDLINMRSIADIKRIAELEKERNEISLAQFVYAYFMDQHRNPIDLYHWLIKWNHLKALKESK